MKRRKTDVVGKASFLPILPAGDLEKWLASHCRTKPGVEERSSVGRQSPGNPRCSVGDTCNHSKSAFISDVDHPSPVKGCKRQDMPVVRRNCEASGPRQSFEFLDDPHAVDSAMAAFRKDFYAASSRRPRDAMVQTWTKFHRQWFGNDSIVPLTVESLEKVSCLFKLGSYKSYKNYLSRIKEIHTECGHEWTLQLHNAARRCTRSVLRGLGGPVRSEAFDLDGVVKHLLLNDVAVDSEGPRSPLAAVVVGTFFLLRELELSAIDMEDVSFTANTVTLCLPVSKVDWQAKGCRRTWSCICELGYHCPVHILRKYDEGLRKEGRRTGPWILSNTDGRCTKSAMVNMIREAVVASGGTAKDAEGGWMVTGHTFRVTGARTLSAWGLDPITIQLLGRWGSSAVLGYLAETPLLSFSERLSNRSNLHHLTPGHIQATDIDGQAMTDARLERDSLRGEIVMLKNKVSDLTTSLDGVSQALEAKQMKEVWWVLNDTSKVLHEAVVDLSTPPSTWKTACGWKFCGQPKITTFREPPPIETGRKCPRCMPGDDTSSSSSES